MGEYLSTLVDTHTSKTTELILMKLELFPELESFLFKLSLRAIYRQTYIDLHLVSLL